VDRRASKDDVPFRVHIEEGAKLLLRKRLADFDAPRPVVWIERVGAVGELHRDPEGKAVWSIHHPHPWNVTICGVQEDIPESEFLHIDGFRIVVALVPWPGEAGVRVSVRDGTLQVDPL